LTLCLDGARLKRGFVSFTIFYGGFKMPTEIPKSTRGFASMDEIRHREIAAKGGRAAHEKGSAHEFTSPEAKKAAKRGHELRAAHEFTRAEAIIAGRLGAKARAASRQVAALAKQELASVKPVAMVASPVT